MTLELPTSEGGESELPPLEVRLHARARRLSVRVHMGGRVVVVAPPRTSARQVQRFITEHREWIVDAYRHSAPLTGTALPEEIHLPALRLTLPARYATCPERAAGWSEQGGLLEVRVPVDADDERARVLRGWLRHRAKREVPQLLQPVIEATALRPARVQLRLQKSRWGSCSSSGTVSLNACLLFLEERLMRYLFVHELCHLRHLNHSRRFWELVESFEPQWRECERALDAAWREVPRWALAS